MNLEDKQADLERISELSKIVNDVLYASPSFNTKKLFIENDIYHRLPQEITILDGVQKHKYSFLRRMRAKIELYEIYSKSNDNMITESIISKIGNPNIFYIICNSVIRL